MGHHVPLVNVLTRTPNNYMVSGTEGRSVFLNVMFHFKIVLHLCVCVCMHACTCEGQRTTFRSQSLSFPKWSPVIKLRT